jgi:beta-glucosidase-like glycosyl hydrolase/CubicO group peptidase (beta-lactamase class C family)
MQTTLSVKKFLIISWVILSHIIINAQQHSPLQTKDSISQKKWVDSLLNSMSNRDKIGQLFMVAAYSNRDTKHIENIEKLIVENKIGGLIFMQGTPVKQAILTNTYQSKSKVPLLIGFDGEWGLAMRIDSTYSYPWNMSLGAIRNNKLPDSLGNRIGEQCKRLGIHINFAPVVDINTNPKNPIIGNRSFGENKYNVTQKSLAFTPGLQSQHVLACAKHFPGHGDTKDDSHKVLPIVLFDSIRIDSVELYPYKALFKKGLGSLMTAHLSIPSLEKDSLIPTSISKSVVTDLLQKKLGFKGLIITDALNMKGAANFATPGEIDLAAFLAGNDVLLFPEDVPKAINLFEKALADKKFSQQRLDKSVRKILQAKYWVGLHNYKPIITKDLTDDLNTLKDTLLHRKLVNQSITLLKRSDVFPIKDMTQKIAYVKLGDAENTAFTSILQNYTDINIIKEKNDAQLLKKLKSFDIVLIGFHKSNVNPWKSYTFTSRELLLLQKISLQNKVILSIFTSPYSLLQIQNFKEIEGLIVSYQNSKIAQELTAQKIFGALETTGKLPVSITNHFPEGFGLFSPSLRRLSYGLPEEVGISSSKLQRIDSIAQEVIKQEMAPGLQVLVARYGKVIYHKSFGYFTFDKKQKVKKTDLYDLASITKIMGGLPLIMKAEEEGKFKLDQTLGKVMPLLKNTNKDTINIKKALSHYGQIKSWIQYYPETLDSITKKPLPLYYQDKPSKDYSIKITDKLYLRSDYQDSIYHKIAQSKLREKAGYKYSGLIFYLTKKYMEDTYHKKMELLDDSLFYKPLGATTLTYLPLRKFSKNRIVPTEKDDYFRHKLLQGTVHDMGAAMMDGVSGNAGLFSNANDLAKMMQMYLQKGFYGGKRYFKSKTIDKFNHRYYEKDSIRRGLGFDKPQLNPEITATCGCVSDKSFGHSGFTGTYVWADPETGLLYIFLSNRVYPNMSNTKLVEEDIRTKTQQIVVDAIVF